MSINFSLGKALTPEVKSPETMLELIRAYRLIPFFRNAIPGYSIEEHTAPDAWFTEENLGPWDWKIECVRSGEIAYGKFLWGGKAAFATVDVYREIMNWRRSLPKYAPKEDQQRVLDLIREQGAVSVAEVRKLFGIKKGAADALLAKLQMQTRVVTGDIIRVYHGPDLHYSGWQRSSFCSPDELFDDQDFPFPGFKPAKSRPERTPAQSLEFVKKTVRDIFPDVPDPVLLKMLG